MKTLQLEQFADYLAPRARAAHKGDFGYVLVVGGDEGYSGAALLAAEAALRVGAGLVGIATRAEHAKMLNLTRPEIMCHAVQSAADLSNLLARATVIVAGPGLGQAAWGQTLLTAVLAENKPLILDADGLNGLAKQPQHRTHWILTPHPGEAGRLLNQSTQTVQADRVAAIKQLQQRYGGHIILKGAGSLVLSPGQSEPMLCNRGNPGMATGGMGDVLSGVLGGLAAQGIPLDVTAQLGVLIHALAGDLAAETGGERGMLATDLLPFLRKIVNKWS